MELVKTLDNIESEIYYRFNLGVCLAILKEKKPIEYKIISVFFENVKEGRLSLLSNRSEES